MIYKIKGVNKENLKEVRYVTMGDHISNEVNKMSEIDMIRDMANEIMLNENVTYDVAYEKARKIKDGKDVKILKENVDYFPGFETESDDDNVLFGFDN